MFKVSKVRWMNLGAGDVGKDAAGKTTYHIGEVWTRTEYALLGQPWRKVPVLRRVAKNKDSAQVTLENTVEERRKGLQLGPAYHGPIALEPIKQRHLYKLADAKRKNRRRQEEEEQARRCEGGGSDCSSRKSPQHVQVGGGATCCGAQSRLRCGVIDGGAEGEGRDDIVERGQQGNWSSRRRARRRRRAKRMRMTARRMRWTARRVRTRVRTVRSGHSRGTGARGERGGDRGGVGQTGAAGAAGAAGREGAGGGCWNDKERKNIAVLFTG